MRALLLFWDGVVKCVLNKRALYLHLDLGIVDGAELCKSTGAYFKTREVLREDQLPAGHLLFRQSATK